MSASDVSRRVVLSAAGVGLAAAATARNASPAHAEPGRRPNIVWLLSEDNNPYLGAYGDRLADTPTLDRLAAEGVRYQVMYSPAPVCAPSRFSYLTGMYAESCGPAHNMRAIAKMPAEFKGFPEYLRRAGYYTCNNTKTDYNAAIDMAATWDESSPTAHWRNRGEDATFFAQFTDTSTHESRLFSAPDGPTDPADVVVPAFLPDTEVVRADIAHYHDLINAMDRNVAARLEELESDGVLDDTIIFYFGDNGGVLPFSKRFANEDGCRVPLIVWFGKNWRHLAPGRPGTVITTPVTGVDLAPTALTLMGVTPADHMQGRPFLGRGARARDAVFSQRSRMDERYDLQRLVRDERYLYIRNYLPHRPYGMNMAYMWQQKSYQEWEQRHLDGTLTPVQDRFWDPKPTEELYDVIADPDCVTNLAVDPGRKQRAVLARMRRLLRRNQLATNDNGFIPEGHRCEGYRQSREIGAYPIEQVLDIAELAGDRDPSNLDALLRQLDHSNDIVRFWAAQGLLMLGAAAGPASVRLAEALAEESSVYVRIPLAEALARLGHTSHAVKFLAETVDSHSDIRVRLQALNALTWVGTAALPYKDVIERAAESTDEYIKNAGRYLKFVLDGTYTPQTPIFVP